MIIFCKNCTHYSKSFNNGHTNEKCTHLSNIETHINYDQYEYTNKRTPAEINEYNNCVNFEITMFAKTKKFLFKSQD